MSEHLASETSTLPGLSEEYSVAQVEQVSHFLTDQMCTYAERGDDARARLVGIAADVLSSWAMRQRGMQ